MRWRACSGTSGFFIVACALLPFSLVLSAQGLFAGHVALTAFVTSACQSRIGLFSGRGCLPRSSWRPVANYFVIVSENRTRTKDILCRFVKVVAPATS